MFKSCYPRWGKGLRIVFEPRGTWIEPHLVGASALLGVSSPLEALCCLCEWHFVTEGRVDVHFYILYKISIESTCFWELRFTSLRCLVTAEHAPALAEATRSCRDLMPED